MTLHLTKELYHVRTYIGPTPFNLLWLSRRIRKGLPINIEQFSCIVALWLVLAKRAGRSMPRRVASAPVWSAPNSWTTRRDRRAVSSSGRFKKSELQNGSRVTRVRRVVGDNSKMKESSLFHPDRCELHEPRWVTLTEWWSNL